MMRASRRKLAIFLQLLAFLKKHLDINKARLAGNSVYMERIFIMKLVRSHSYLEEKVRLRKVRNVELTPYIIRFMPRVDAFLTHYIIDVDSISEVSVEGRITCNIPRDVKVH